MMFSNVLFLMLHFLQETQAKDTIVSQISQSADTKDCGTTSLPCNTIEYAVDRATAGDTILIDGGDKQQFVYTLVRNVQMNKELTLKTYRDNSRTPIIKVTPPTSQQNESGILFDATKSFSMISLSITSSLNVSKNKTTESSVFRATRKTTSLYTAHIDSCTLNIIWFIRVSGNWNIEFSECKFEGGSQYNSYQTIREYNQMSQSNISFSITNSLISNFDFYVYSTNQLYISKTTTENATIYLTQIYDGIALTIHDCVLNNSSIFNKFHVYQTGCLIYLTHVTFYGTPKSNAFIQTSVYDIISLEFCSFNPAKTIIYSDGHIENISNCNFTSNIKDKSLIFMRLGFKNIFNSIFENAVIYAANFYGIEAFVKSTLFKNSYFFSQDGEGLWCMRNIIVIDSTFLATNLKIFDSQYVFLSNVKFLNLFENKTIKQPYLTMRLMDKLDIQDCIFEGSNTGILDAHYINNITISNIIIRNSTMTQSIHQKFDTQSLIFFPPYPDKIHFVYLSTESFFIGSSDSIYCVLGSTGKGLIKCPSNYNIKKLNMRNLINYTLISCSDCNTNYYSLKKGNLSWGYTYVGFQQSDINCLPCPYEATCENGIRSIGNYWGYETANETIQFLQCPLSYCCSSPSKCLSYDSCAEHRQGILCGDCQNGYSLSLFGYNRCVLTKTCYNAYLWFLLIVFVFIFLITHGYMKDLMLYLHKIIDKSIKNANQQQNKAKMNQHNKEPQIMGQQQWRQEQQNDLNNTDGIDSDLFESNESICQLLPNEGTNQEAIDEPNIVSAIIKIMFFFYQAASVMNIKKTIKTKYSAQIVNDVLFTFFNIRIVATTSAVNACLLKADNIVVLELIKNSILFMMIIFLLAAIGVIEFMKILKKFKCIRDNEDIQQNFYTCITKHTPIHQNVPFLVRLKCTYVQVLLLGYTTISMFSFNMMSCVDVQNISRLYLQGSIKCFDGWWQYIISVFIAVWIIPFFFALYIGCRLLRKCHITPTKFLFILTFPPASLWYYLVKCKLKKRNGRLERNEAITAKHLLLVINEPFRCEESNDGNEENVTVVQWESILILRRLIIIVCSVFVVSLSEKVFAMEIIVICFYVHHLIVQPYKTNRLNTFEMVSLFSLCFLATINMFWALVNDDDIEKNELMRSIGEIAIYVEMLIMLSPFIGILFQIIFDYSKNVYKTYQRKQD